MIGILCCLLNTRTPGKDDEICKRDLLSFGGRAVKFVPDPFEDLEHFCKPGPPLTSQSFWGRRRMRAPFAPPRLSEPRKVDADADVVETSSGDGEP